MWKMVEEEWIQLLFHNKIAHSIDDTHDKQRVIHLQNYSNKKHHHHNHLCVDMFVPDMIIIIMVIIITVHPKARSCASVYAWTGEDMSYPLPLPNLPNNHMVMMTMQSSWWQWSICRRWSRGWWRYLFLLWNIQEGNDRGRCYHAFVAGVSLGCLNTVQLSRNQPLFVVSEHLNIGETWFIISPCQRCCRCTALQTKNKGLGF